MPADAHLCSMADLDDPDLRHLFARASAFAEGKHPTQTPHALIVTAFFENSTRTRCSFEIAARRLGAGVVHLDVARSSTAKGESLIDTVRTLDAMGPDVLIVRHSSSGAAAFIAREVRAAVVNAGDGAREHPTQALLDAMAIHQTLGDLQGRTVAIVGDVAHSRVARSNLQLLQRLGARVRFVGPRAFVSPLWTLHGAEVHHDLETGLAGADVVYLLRVQLERLGAVTLFSPADYARRFGLTPARFERLAPHALLMHPGPVNRGVEIDGSLLDHPRCLVAQQVSCGVWMRTAVLEHILVQRGAASTPAPLGACL